LSVKMSSAEENDAEAGTDTEQTVFLLAEELDRLRCQLKDQSAWIQSQDRQPHKPLMMVAGRRLDRFRGRPERADDPSINEWITDVRSHAAARNLENRELGTLIIDNLAGQARQEILGRGGGLEGKPEEIFKILSRVFGDGDQLPRLQSTFYAMRQGNQDLLSFSLKMVELFDRMRELDPSLKERRNETLKGRFAEAVEDEGLRRELVRLNLEYPEKTFFDLRDRGVTWLGQTKKKAVHSQEATAEGPEETQLQRQAALIEKQQQQIDSLLKALNGGAGPKRDGWRKPAGDRTDRSCWTCGSMDHWKRDCPNRRRQTEGKPKETGNG